MARGSRRARILWSCWGLGATLALWSVSPRVQAQSTAPPEEEAPEASQSQEASPDAGITDEGDADGSQDGEPDVGREERHNEARDHETDGGAVEDPRETADAEGVAEEEAEGLPEDEAEPAPAAPPSPGMTDTDDPEEVAEAAAALVDPAQTAEEREARESRFVGDAQDGRSTTNPDDLPAPDSVSSDVLVEMATYDLTVDITPYAWIRPEGLLQLRWTANYREEPSTSREYTHAFSIPRARFAVWAGVTEHLRFRMRFGISSGGELNIEQAFADAALGPLTLRVGRFWLPIYWGGGPAPNLLTKAEYSLAANYLDGGQTQGASLSWGTDHTRLRLFIGDGLRTGFAEFGQDVDADLAITGRIDARLLTSHDWTRFDEFSSFRGSDIALRFGATVHGQRGGGTGTTQDLDYVIITADVQLEGDGFHVFAGGGWVRVAVGDASVFNNFATEVQAGYFVLEPLELWASYNALLADGEPQPPGLGVGTGETDLHTLSAGMTWYIVPRAHRAKLVLHFDWVMNALDTSLIGPSYNNGLLPTANGDQWLARIQLTTAF